MPYINVQFTKGATKEAKREIVKGVTDLMVEHLGKSLSSKVVGRYQPVALDALADR